MATDFIDRRVGISKLLVSLNDLCLEVCSRLINYWSPPLFPNISTQDSILRQDDVLQVNDLSWGLQASCEISNLESILNCIKYNVNRFIQLIFYPLNSIITCFHLLGTDCFRKFGIYAWLVISCQLRLVQWCSCVESTDILGRSLLVLVLRKPFELTGGSKIWGEFLLSAVPDALIPYYVVQCSCNNGPG